MAVYPFQTQSLTLSGSGNAINDTTLVLSSFNDINGVAVTSMAPFGAKGSGTIEPNNGTQEEAITFTGLTANSNGTVTLSGVSTVLFQTPFTETSGLAKQHPGGATFIITNTAWYENENSIVANDETITGKWTFPNNANTPVLGASYVAPTVQTQVASKGYVDAVAISGAPNATTSVQGLVQLATAAQVLSKTATGSTGATLVSNPSLQASTLLSDYVVDTGTANTYAIAPNPAITAYAAGQTITFKAIHTNTGASTLNVNALGAKNILKDGGQFALAAGDIKNGGIFMVEYDGTQFQLISKSALPKISQAGTEIYGTSTTGNTAYIVGLTPSVSAYVAGLMINVQPDTGGGHATINVNSLGVKNIMKYKNGSVTAVETGDIIANQVFTGVYDGTQFQLVNQLSKTPMFTAGTTSKNVADADTTQAIAHGLGKIPKYVKITAIMGTTSVTPAFHQALTTYDGTTQNSVSVYGPFNAAPTVDTNFRVSTQDNTTSAYNTGVVTFNATNINIAWTKTSTPTGMAQILWEATG